MPSTRWSLGALLMALTLLLPGENALAQALTTGTRVRVKSSQVVAPIIGTYQGTRRDTVVVIEDGPGAQVWTFAPAAIDRIEVSAGMKGGNSGPTTRWALIGAGVGAGLGVITAIALESGSSAKYNDLLSGLVGAAIGGGIGAAYGYRQLAEHWTPVPIPRRVGLLPTRNGLRLAFSASF